MSSQAGSRTADHPAPQRAAVSLASLLFGLGCAPLAWAAQVCTGLALAGMPGNRGALWLVYAASVMLPAIALGVSLANYRRTATESSGNSGHLLEVGHGRTRFLALWGVLLSAGFGIAAALNAVALVLLPPDGVLQ